MPSLLVIESSPRGSYSVSRTLTATFVEDWKAAHPGGTVVSRDLTSTELPFVDLPWIAGAYTPDEARSPEMKQALTISDALIAELMATDHIVLGTSMYNFSTPANLKAYIDHIVRVNVTVSPAYEGLVKGKKMTAIVAAGGSYDPGTPTESYNLMSGYLKQIFGFIGISDLTIVLAGGTSAIDRGEKPLSTLTGQFEPAVATAAKA